MICQTDISNVKAELAKNIGRKVIIKGKKERKKFFEEKAIIKNTYPAHFYVKNAQNRLDFARFLGVFLGIFGAFLRFFRANIGRFSPDFLTDFRRYFSNAFLNSRGASEYELLRNSFFNSGCNLQST